MVSRMVDIQTVSIVIASVSVVVASAYYTFQIRNQTKLRHMDLTMRLNSWWTSEETVKQWLRTMDLEFKDFHDFTKKYGLPFSEKPEHIAVLTTVNHFDAIGYLLHRKMVDFGLVELLPTIATWEKVKPIIEGLRERHSRPILTWFEYLYNETKKREQLASKTA